jgi:Pvc16 N-terminal domain
MATDRAITAISLALRGLLFDARPTTGDLKDATVELFLAEGFKAPVNNPIVSIFLYRTQVSQARRNLPPKIGADGKKYRPPLPLDLHYMFTPWAKKAETQQLLLAWMMRVLDDSPTLSSGYLNSFDPDNTPFAPDETVDLVYEPISIQDMLNIWEVQKHNFQVSVTYVVRVVPIDSTVLMPAPGGRAVQTRV